MKTKKYEVQARITPRPAEPGTDWGTVREKGTLKPFRFKTRREAVRAKEGLDDSSNFTERRIVFTSAPLPVKVGMKKKIKTVELPADLVTTLARLVYSSFEDLENDMTWLTTAEWRIVQTEARFKQLQQFAKQYR